MERIIQEDIRVAEEGFIIW